MSNDQPRRLLQWDEAPQKENKEQREVREGQRKFIENDRDLNAIFSGLTQLTSNTGRVTLARAFGERTFPLEITQQAHAAGTTPETLTRRWSSQEHWMMDHDSACIHLLFTEATRAAAGRPRGEFVHAALIRHLHIATQYVEQYRKTNSPDLAQAILAEARVRELVEWLGAAPNPSADAIRRRILEYIAQINQDRPAQGGLPRLDIANLEQATTVGNLSREFYRRNTRIPLAERGVNTIRELLVELTRLRTELDRLPAEERQKQMKAPRAIPQRVRNLLQFEGIPAQELFANPDAVTMEQLQQAVFTQLECMGFNVAHLREQDRQLERWQTSLLLGNITNISLTQRLDITQEARQLPLERATNDMRRLTTLSLMIWNDVERFTEMTDRYMELCATRGIAQGERGRIFTEEQRLQRTLGSLNSTLPHLAFFHRFSYHLDFVLPTEDRHLQQLDHVIQRDRKALGTLEASNAALRQQGGRQDDIDRNTKEIKRIVENLNTLVALRERAYKAMRDPAAAQESRKKIDEEICKVLEDNGMEPDRQDNAAHSQSLLDDLLNIATAHMRIPDPEMNVLIENLPDADQQAQAKKFFAQQLENHGSLRSACDNLGQSLPEVEKSMREGRGLPYAQRVQLVDRVNAIHRHLQLRIRYDLSSSTNPQITVPGRIPGPADAVRRMMPRLQLPNWMRHIPGVPNVQDAVKKIEQEDKERQAKLQRPAFTPMHNAHAQLPGGMFYNLLAADMQAAQRALVSETPRPTPVQAAMHVTRYIQNAEMFRQARRAGLRRSFSHVGIAAVRALRPQTDITEPLNDAQLSTLFLMHQDGGSVLQIMLQGFINPDARNGIDGAITDFRTFHQNGLDAYMRMMHDVALNINEDGWYLEMALNSVAELISWMGPLRAQLRKAAWMLNPGGMAMYELSGRRKQAREDLDALEKAFEEINKVRTEFQSAVTAAQEEQKQIAQLIERLGKNRKILDERAAAVTAAQQEIEKLQKNWVLAAEQLQKLRKQNADKQAIDRAEKDLNAVNEALSAAAKRYGATTREYLEPLGEFFAIGIDMERILDAGINIRVGNAMAIGAIPVSVHAAPEIGQMMMDYASLLFLSAPFGFLARHLGIGALNSRVRDVRSIGGGIGVILQDAFNGTMPGLLIGTGRRAFETGRRGVEWFRGTPANLNVGRPPIEIIVDAIATQQRMTTYMQTFRRVPGIAAADEVVAFRYEIQLGFQQLSRLEAGLAEGSAELRQIQTMRAALTQQYFERLIGMYSTENTQLAGQLRALMRNGTLDAGVETAMWTAHRVSGRGVAAINRKREILQAANIAPEVIEILLDTGICGGDVAQSMSLAALRRTAGPHPTPFMRQLLALGPGAIADAQRGAALTAAARHPQLISSLSELEGARLVQAVELLGRSEMAGFNAARLGAEDASKLVRFLAEGGANDIRAFLALSNETRALAISLHPAEMAHLLSACRESVHLRPVIAGIQNAGDLSRFARNLSQLTAAELRGLSAARTARLGEILRSPKAAEFIIHLNQIAGAEARGAFLRSATRPRLGVGGAIMATTAVFGEIWVGGADIYQEFNERQAINNLTESMRKTFMAVPPGQERSPFTETRAGDDVIFVHTVSGAQINAGAMARKARDLLGTNWMRHATNFAGLASAIAGFIPGFGWMITAGAFIVLTPIRQGLSDSDAQRFAQLYADLPTAALALLPANLLFGRGRENVDVILQMRTTMERWRVSDYDMFEQVLLHASGLGTLMRLRDSIAGLGILGEKERTARLRELMDEGIDRALFHVFVTEAARQNVDLSSIAIRNAQGQITQEALDVLWQDRAFLRQSFRHFLPQRNILQRTVTDTSTEQFNTAVRNTMGYYLRCKYVQHFRELAAPLAAHEKSLAQLTKQLAPHLTAAPANGNVLQQLTAIPQIIAAVGANAQAADGWRVLAGLAPQMALATAPVTQGLVEILEGWQLQQEILPLLQIIGGLGQPERANLIRVLELLPAQQRAGLLRGCLHSNARQEILKICAQAFPGMLTAREAESRRAARDVYGNSFVGGQAFSIADLSVLLENRRDLGPRELPIALGRTQTTGDVPFGYESAQNTARFLSEQSARYPREGIGSALGVLMIRMGGRPARIGIAFGGGRWEVTDPHQSHAVGWMADVGGSKIFFTERQGRIYWCTSYASRWTSLADTTAGSGVDGHNGWHVDAAACAIFANNFRDLCRTMVIGANPNGAAILAAVEMRLFARGARRRFEHGVTWYDVPGITAESRDTVVSYGHFGGRFYVALPDNPTWQRVATSIQWPVTMPGRERFQQITQNVRDIEQGLDPVEYAMVNWITNPGSRGENAPVGVQGEFLATEAVGHLNTQPPVAIDTERVAVYRIRVPYLSRAGLSGTRQERTQEMYCMWFNGRGYYHVVLLHGSYGGAPRIWQPIENEAGSRFASNEWIPAVNNVRQRIASNMQVVRNRSIGQMNSPAHREARHAASVLGDRGAAVFLSSVPNSRLQNSIFGDDPNAPQILKGQDFPEEPSSEQWQVIRNAVAWMDRANIGRRIPLQSALTRLMYLNAFVYEQQGARYEAVMVTCVVSHDNPAHQDLHHIVAIREVGVGGPYQFLPNISDAGQFIGEVSFRRAALQHNTSLMRTQQLQRERKQKEVVEKSVQNLSRAERLFCASDSGELMFIGITPEGMQEYAGTFAVDNRIPPPALDFGDEINTSLRSLTPVSSSVQIETVTKALRGIDQALIPAIAAELRARGFILMGGEQRPFPPAREAIRKNILSLSYNQQQFAEFIKKQRENPAAGYGDIARWEKGHEDTTAKQIQQTAKMVQDLRLSYTAEQEILKVLSDFQNEKARTRISDLLGYYDREPFTLMRSSQRTPRFTVYMTTVLVSPDGAIRYRFGRLSNASHPQANAVAGVPNVAGGGGFRPVTRSAEGFYQPTADERNAAQQFERVIDASPLFNEIPLELQASVNTLLESGIAGTPETTVFHQLRDFLAVCDSDATRAELQRRVVQSYIATLDDPPMQTFLSHQRLRAAIQAVRLAHNMPQQQIPGLPPRIYNEQTIGLEAGSINLELRTRAPRQVRPQQNRPIGPVAGQQQ